jgi:NAD(P)-dependent dehydrogenase (short-subunit alcohol dehydrogenase family)
MALLEGKIALITGAGSGIGREVANRFIAEGAKVAAFDISESKLKHMVQDCGEQLIAVQGDVRKLEDNKRAVSAAVNGFGALDIFVGNAGIFDGFRSLLDLSTESVDAVFDEIFGVNVKGYLLGAKAAAPALIKRKGNMIFTASSAGFYSGGGGPLYTASKHAVVGLIRQLAYELAPFQVRVNGVAPGGTLGTDLHTAASQVSDQRDINSQHSEERLRQREERMRQSSLLGIVPLAEDHAFNYVFLASDQSRILTGQIIHSDCGLRVKSPHSRSQTGPTE